MRRWIDVFRFFAVAPPMPLLMIGALVVVTSVAAIAIVVDPQMAVRALTPVLLLQLFACSSGFDVPARRGHYDLLMTRGQTRFQIVTAHWAASALPGVVGWLVLALIDEAVRADASQVSLFSTGTMAAMSLVSTLPWAFTLRLPRFAGAIGWLLLVTLAMLVAPDALTTSIAAGGGAVSRALSDPPGLLAVGRAVSDPPGLLAVGRALSDPPGLLAVGRALSGSPGLLAWLQTAGATLIYPPLLVGSDISGSPGFVALPGLLLAAAALTVAFWSAIRRDIPLEAAQ
jgi:hypothetical protein